MSLPPLPASLYGRCTGCRLQKLVHTEGRWDGLVVEHDAYPNGPARPVRCEGSLALPDMFPAAALAGATVVALAGAW